MTYKIKKIQLKKFLGDREFSIDFNDNINFFIGRNGTGKTTFIKLIHAALSLDIAELNEIYFEEINISFLDSQANTTPQLKIKRLSLSRPIFEFKFRYSSGSERYKRYVSKSEIFPMFFDEEYTSSFGRKSKGLNSKNKSDPTINDLRRSFGKSIQMSWLPLMRYRGGSSHYYDPEEGETISVEPINSKISDLIAQMTRYFSSLETRSADASKRFQRDYFLSLLAFAPEHFSKVEQKIGESVLEAEEKVIREIFNELEFEIAEYDDQVAKHFTNVRDAISRTFKPGNTINIKDYFSITDTMRLHKIVERWKEYEAEKNLIFEPKTNFSNLMNKLLINKSFNFDDGNQPKIMSSNNSENIRLENLSSGEKQMFVMMAETLLQEQRGFIFLADEPELSLHIEWQESLVRNIQKMNSNCQIIFATHSPDVVSIHQDNVIDFEKI